MYANESKSARPGDPMERQLTAMAVESDNLNVSLNSLGVTAEVLVQRLAASVLRPEVVVQMANGGSTRAPMPDSPPRAQMCNAAERLLEQRMRVENITAQLQQALDRLEA